MMTQSIPQLTGPSRPQENEAELATYLDVLWENRWLIATITLVVTLLGATYAFITTPVYQANLLIHVEEEGPSKSQNIVGDLQSMFDVKASALAEMALLPRHRQPAPVHPCRPEAFPARRLLAGGSQPASVDARVIRLGRLHMGRGENQCGSVQCSRILA